MAKTKFSLAFTVCHLLPIILSQNYLLPIISVLAENTLLKTAYHFLLLLVGFDTLTIERTMIDPLYLWVISGGRRLGLWQAGGSMPEREDE